VSRAVEDEADKVLPLATSTLLKRKLPYDDDDDNIVLFRRVRIKTLTVRSTEDSHRHAPSYDPLLRILNDMQNHPASWPFIRPLRREDVADYYGVIKQPMDLGTMEAKLEGDIYATPEGFIRDAKLVFDNCRKYNETTPYAKSANRLEKYMWQQVKAIPELSHLEP
jgi:Bromodomain